MQSHATLLQLHLADDYVEKHRVHGVLQEIARLHHDFPGVFPEFKPLVFCERPGGRIDRLLGVRASGKEYYQPQEILSYLASVHGRIEAYLDDPTSHPLTETRFFTFVKDVGVRAIVERDYDEIQRAFVARCWKSVIILAGGAVEAILTDLLLQHENRAKACKKAPRVADILKWDLESLIDVAVELTLVSGGVARLSHPVRQYRNLVHPGNELRTKLKFDREEARIALEVINILHRDLSVRQVAACLP